MATEAIENSVSGDDAGDSAVPWKSSGKRGLLVLAIAGIAAGAAAGVFVIAPMIATPSGAATAPKAERRLPGATVTHSIENLVLNPARSGGKRFLMAAATFELRDGLVQQRLKDRDAEVRDRILSLLGKKTVDELSDISRRHAIKQEVLDSVASLFPAGSVRQVFFSQFVIQ